jgi:hypothetical protein
MLQITEQPFQLTQDLITNLDFICGYLEGYCEESEKRLKALAAIEAMRTSTTLEGFCELLSENTFLLNDLGLREELNKLRHNVIKIFDLEKLLQEIETCEAEERKKKIDMLNFRLNQGIYTVEVVDLTEFGYLSNNGEYKLILLKTILNGTATEETQNYQGLLEGLIELTLAKITGASRFEYWGILEQSNIELQRYRSLLAKLRE